MSRHQHCLLCAVIWEMFQLQGGDSAEISWVQHRLDVRQEVGLVTDSEGESGAGPIKGLKS
ncbi:unnamed protein product [Prunus armeniaca]